MSGALAGARRGARLPGSRRLVALLAGAAVLLLAAVLVVRACDGTEPPETGAARLMPDATLVFASVSTDGDRAATERAADLAARFGAYEAQRDALLRRLSGADRSVDVGEDVAPWLGDEAAIGLMDAGSETAGSIVAVEVTDAEKARAFVGRHRGETVRRRYRGVETVRYGTVTTAVVDGYLVIGQDPTVQMAIERGRPGAEARSLADDRTYRRAVAALPEERFTTAYASADGLRRLLMPQGGLPGALATLLDTPGLRGVGVGAEARQDEARIVTRQIVDPGARRAGGATPERFEPTLVEAVPEDALAYLGASGISGPLQRLIVSAVGGAQGGDGVASILGRLRDELERETGGGLQRDLLALFDGEVAVAILPETPAPLFALVTRTQDETATRDTLDRLRAPLARMLRPEGEPELRWESGEVAGREVHTLRLPTGAAISYAVFDGRLVLSSGPEGIRRVAGDEGSLADTQQYREVLGDRPEEVRSLGFLDFSQLLELGEQTGLNDSRPYLAAREDLQRISAVGISSSGSEGESTAEILLSIP